MWSRGVIGNNERVMSKDGWLWSGSGCKGLREVVPKVDDVSLVDGVFDGAFGREGEKDVVIGEGMVVTSSSLEMLTNSCLDEIMVSLIFLEVLKEEA
uniref:Uncharacterized protein n=1 Tax=Tanacetum cinerariifolium TaxID=118510 RepID=A0A6L2JAN3_TANCI|nr:hypothetical protein [Tanacetum cinerariifolium]